jgi:pimeloyl-ACP methyl ester carboxylesterase
MKNAAAALLALGLGLAGAAVAAADPLDAKLPAQAWTKTIGSIQVQKYGAGSPALVLVAGLGCGAWSWRDTIGREASAHAVYTVTLAGFDGVPAGDGATLDGAEASIAMLMTSEHLDRPVLVGHSLGGTLTLRFGLDHPDLVRGIVAVDGAPVMPQLAMATPEQRAAAATEFYTTVTSATPEAYAKLETQFTDDYVTDRTLAAKVSTLVLRSDQKAVAEYGKELYQLDLRPQLSKLSVPAAEIAPIPGLPLPTYLPAFMAAMSPADRRGATLSFYQSLFANAPAVKIIPVDDSRHFVMLDQPAAFAAALDGFVATLK